MENIFKIFGQNKCQTLKLRSNFCEVQNYFNLLNIKSHETIILWFLFTIEFWVVLNFFYLYSSAFPNDPTMIIALLCHNENVLYEMEILWVAKYVWLKPQVALNFRGKIGLYGCLEEIFLVNVWNIFR